LRAVSFFGWPDFDQPLWQELTKRATHGEGTKFESPILGSDSDPEILAQARTNATLCGLHDQVILSQTTLMDIEAPTKTGNPICNPLYYGERLLGNAEELGSLYTSLGNVFKQCFNEWTAFILMGSKELAKQVAWSQSFSSHIPVYNGSLACTFLKYELY
jgi:putative N6-adenine-specific DNA methylase